MSTITCPNCRSTGWALTSKVGALETWCCDQCHHHEMIHVYDTSVELSSMSAQKPVFELIGHWRSKPSKEQAEKLASVVPALRHARASALIRSALEGTSLSLGRFTDAEASEIEPVLLSLGIAVERAPIPVG